MSDHCHSASLSAFGGTDVVKHLCWLLLELMSAILQVTELNLNFFRDSLKLSLNASLYNFQKVPSMH